MAELERLNNERIERVATRERYEKDYLIFDSKEDHGKIEKLGLRGQAPEDIVIRGKDPDEEVQTGESRGRRRRRSRREGERERQRPRRARAKRKEKTYGYSDTMRNKPVDEEEVAVGATAESQDLASRDSDISSDEEAVGIPPKSMMAGLAAGAGAMAARCIQEILHKYGNEMHFRQTRNWMAERDDRRARRERSERGVYGDMQFREQRTERNSQADRKERANRYEYQIRRERLDNKDRAEVEE